MKRQEQETTPKILILLTMLHAVLDLIVASRMKPHKKLNQLLSERMSDSERPYYTDR